MNTIYKILFEVKLLHEYYLTGTKGENIFSEINQQQRVDHLFEQFQKGKKSINRDIEFVIPESLQQLFTDYHLKVIPSYSGFKVAIKCRAEILTDGTIVYKPFISIPDDLEMMILLQQKNNISSFSNTSLKNPLSAVFLFSNDDGISVKQSPFLSAPVPAKDDTRIYEQGELAFSTTTNKVNIFLNNDAILPWLELNGTGYVNESDRLLVPFTFSYSFATAGNITDAIFSLKDSTGNEIKKITATGSKPLRSVLLNFRPGDNTIINLPEKSVTAESIYTLDVTASNGYIKSHSLLFAGDEISLTGVAGLITVKPKVANALFNLTDSSGYLYTRILPGGVKQPAPIFELWMKSRLAFWKYRNNKQRKIKTTAATLDVLTTVDDDGDGVSDGKLITRNPVPLTYTALLLKKTDGTFQYFPNPLPGEPVRTGPKDFLDIMVPESTMFPFV